MYFWEQQIHSHMHFRFMLLAIFVVAIYYYIMNTIVVHSKDNKRVGVAHKTTSPKNKL